MDTSEEYIVMCEKAVEIHDDSNFTDGEYVAFPNGECGMLFDNYDGTDGYIWLPRQDELQAMLKWEEEGRYGKVLIDVFYGFAKSNWDTRPRNQNNNITWEQLWLAFVMSELYQKQWDGKDWIPIRKEVI